MSEEFGDGPAGGLAEAAVISLMSSAFEQGRGGHATQDVIARGRRLRRRRRAMPALGALGALGAAAALAVALTGPSSGALNVDNAGFSVHTDAASGRVTVTIKQIFDENELKTILAKAGIRAYFASRAPDYDAGGAKRSCSWPGAENLNVKGVLSSTSKPQTFVIDPSKMPNGSVLAFEYRPIDQRAALMATLLSGEPRGCGALQTGPTVAIALCHGDC